MKVQQFEDHKRITARNSRRRKRSALTNRQKAEVMALAKKVDERDQETYFHDLSRQTQNMQNAGSIVDLSLVPQGDGVSARNGDEIDVKFFQLRGALFAPTVYNSGSGASQGIDYRIMVIQWHPNSGTEFPNMSSLFENTTNPLSFRNLDFTKQYRVLYEDRGVLVNSAGNDDSAKYVEFTIPGKQIRKIGFNDAASTGEDHIFIVCQSSEVTNGPRLIYTTRMGYQDA